MATSGARRRGFVPIRHQSGGAVFRSKLYPADNVIMMQGDGVCLVSGKAKAFLTANASTWLGVARAFYDSNKKPLTHVQPGRGPYALVGGGGYVDVWDDPNQVFLVESRVSAGPTTVGQKVLINATAGVTAVGISRHHVDGFTADDAGSPLMVIGIGQNELDEVGGTGNDVEVVATIHVFRP